MSFRFFIRYDRRYGASVACAVEQSLIAQAELKKSSDLHISKNQNTQALPASSNPVYAIFHVKNFLLFKLLSLLI